uniref:Uncharacterized protein n=1 Tax=Rhizophora mucronata TaxID=61149 RepID=A0A2P2NPN6_RHIMU
MYTYINNNTDLKGTRKTSQKRTGSHKTKAIKVGNDKNTTT